MAPRTSFPVYQLHDPAFVVSYVCATLLRPPESIGEWLGHVSHQLPHQLMSLLHHCLTHLCIVTPSKGHTVHPSIRPSAVLVPLSSWHKASTITSSPQEGHKSLPGRLVSMVHLLIGKNQVIMLYK